MEYELGPLLLYSKDKIRMMDLLSDVFDFDVDAVADSIHRGPLSLKLIEADSPYGSGGIVFSFKVKSEHELKEIMSKYNFFLYRKSDCHTTAEKLELIQTDTKKTLSISDIDQRLWQFEFQSTADV